MNKVKKLSSNQKEIILKTIKISDGRMFLGFCICTQVKLVSTYIPNGTIKQ